MKKCLSFVLAMAMVASFIVCPAMAIEPTEMEKINIGDVIAHSETWVTPNKRIEVTVYDLGDGVTCTETIIDDYGNNLQRASGTKTQTSTVEIKKSTEVIATITVSGTFSYDGKDVKVTDSSYSRSVKLGYTEDSWSTGQRDSNAWVDNAIVNAILIVKERDNDSGKSYTGYAYVSCGKNG